MNAMKCSLMIAGLLSLSISMAYGSDTNRANIKGMTLVDTTGWGVKLNKLTDRITALENELSSLKKQLSDKGVTVPDTAGQRIKKTEPLPVDRKMEKYLDR
jgi:hypothetical protein